MKEEESILVLVWSDRAIVVFMARMMRYLNLAPISIVLLSMTAASKD